jgi:hypothetical protein
LFLCIITVQKLDRGVEKKQKVPLRDEKPIQGLVSDKNFIVANAVENILAGKTEARAQTDISVRLNKAFHY